MKTLMCLLIALAMLVTAGVASADVVANSKHNLSSGGGQTIRATAGPGANEVCVFCHTPHKGSLAAQPLWNRTIDTSAYTMYNSGYSSTINMTVESAPVSVSAACLSCHDAATALNSLINESGSGLDTGTLTFTGGTVIASTGVTGIGKDLRDDHPISITYSQSLDSAFQSSPTNGVTLYNNRVECGSCHNPHDNVNGTFLRISNSGSNLCYSCHIK